MEASTTEQTKEPKIDLEDQFILRLPQPQSEAVRAALRKLKAKKFKKFLTIYLDNSKKDVHRGMVKVKKHYLQAKLVRLPCIIESYKTVNKVHLFKTANVSQMLVCQPDAFELSDEEATEVNNNVKVQSKQCVFPHGITPPLKNVVQQRFRKVLRNKDNLAEVAEIEKEVLWLLRADNEAVSTRFEIHYDELNQFAVNERTIFGEVISDSESHETPLSSAKTSTSELNDGGRTSNTELNY